MRKAIFITFLKEVWRDETQSRNIKSGVFIEIKVTYKKSVVTFDSDKENRAHKVTVVKTFYHYLEMKPAKPGYQKLSQLLESRIMKNFDRYVHCCIIF